jgi:hypothetical protein
MEAVLRGPSNSDDYKYAYGSATIEGETKSKTFMVSTPLYATLADVVVKGATIEVEVHNHGAILEILDAKKVDVKATGIGTRLGTVLKRLVG